MNGLREAMNGLHDATNGLREAMNGLHEAMNGLHEAMNGLHDAMNGLHDAMNGLQEAMIGLQGYPRIHRNWWSASPYVTSSGFQPYPAAVNSRIGDPPGRISRVLRCSVSLRTCCSGRA